jgi:hypothetical protein
LTKIIPYRTIPRLVNVEVLRTFGEIWAG